MDVQESDFVKNESDGVTVARPDFTEAQAGAAIISFYLILVIVILCFQPDCLMGV